MKCFFTILIITFCNISFGQRCATDAYAAGTPGQSLQRTYSSQSHSGRDTLEGEVIVIPVVFHVLYNDKRQDISDDRIKAQLAALNRDFRRKNADTINTPEPFKKLAADTRITFCLAQVDPNGFKTTGIVRKYTKEKLFLADDQMKYSAKGGSDAWDASRYLNIWICDLFGRTLAYATMPGGNPKTDGIVVQYGVVGDQTTLSGPYNMGRTLTHEAGHWLGLKHIWGDVEDKGCGDDGIDDTPPQSYSSNGCSSFPRLSACSVDQYGDMFMNYMDFSDDACMNMFTHGQAIRMRSQFAAGGLRNSFLDSGVCDGSGAEEAPVAEEKEIRIRVYPNPVVDRFFIDFENEANPTAKIISIYNVQGKLIERKTMQSVRQSFSLSHYPNGLYVISVTDGSVTKTFKVMKQSDGKH